MRNVPYLAPLSLLLLATVSLAFLHVAGCTRAPSPARQAPRPPASNRGTPDAEDPVTRSAVLARDAAEAERARRFSDARQMYMEAAKLDPRNVAAVYGRDRMIHILGEPPFDHGEARINRERTEIPHKFNAHVEQAEQELAAQPPNIQEALGAFEQARAAALENPAIFTPETIRGWNSRLVGLHRRAIEAENKEREAARPTYPPCRPIRGLGN